MNTGAIDSHKYPNENEETEEDANESEISEPQYANVGQNAQSSTVVHVRQTSDDGLPIPPYMPMQQSMSKRSTSLEKRIKKKKEKEGCKQQ